jgi:hypothetical protein
MQLFSRITQSETDPSRCINVWSDSKELSHLIINCQLEGIIIVPIMAVEVTYVCYSLQYVRAIRFRGIKSKHKTV